MAMEILPLLKKKMVGSMMRQQVSVAQLYRFLY
jgi:hypothetical protein